MLYACPILSSVACPALQHFSILYSYHKRHDFREKKIRNTKYVLIFSTTFVRNISHSKNNWARYDQKLIKVIIESTSYSCLVLMKLEFSRLIFEKYCKYQISWKSVQWEARCSIRTDMTNLIVAYFRNFEKEPKNATFTTCAIINVDNTRV